MALTNSFDSKINFWKANPDLILAGPFKQIYDSDRSKGKDDSSKLLHFVALCYDNESKYYKLIPAEKHKYAGKDICGDGDFYTKNKVEADLAISFYIKLNDDTPARRALRAWEKKMEERSEFIDSTPYNLDNADQLDKMMANTKKLFDDFKRIQEDLSKEPTSTASKGDRELSLSDRGII
jgi:hypothetical protein